MLAGNFKFNGKTYYTHTSNPPLRKGNVYRGLNLFYREDGRQVVVYAVLRWDRATQQVTMPWCSKPDAGQGTIDVDDYTGQLEACYYVTQGSGAESDTVTVPGFAGW
jgi:hypothetical protein